MKGSFAVRVLFRCVVLAFLVYAMLLTWWTPFTGDSFMHSVFGAQHRLSFWPVLERCWWSYLNWNPRLGEFLAIFTATAGKWLFCLVNPFVVLSLALMMFYLARGRRVRPGDWRDVLLFTVGAGSYRHYRGQEARDGIACPLLLEKKNRYSMHLELRSRQTARAESD